MTNKIKGNKGFTLVEIIVALAILALLSGTLLQVFVLSSDMNSRADDLDRANVVATSMAEEFKSGANALAFTNREIFFNDNWQQVPAAQARFRLTATVNRNSGQGNNHVFAPPIDMVGEMDAAIAVTNSQGFVENNITYGAAQTDINGDGRLSVRLDYPNDNRNYEILLTNNTGIPVDLFVFGTDNTHVRLRAIAGESSITCIPAGILNADTRLNQLTLTIQITRINDGVQLVNYAVSKYIAQ